MVAETLAAPDQPLRFADREGRPEIVAPRFI